MAARLNWGFVVLGVGIALGLWRMLAVGFDLLAAAGILLLVVLFFVRPRASMPWREAYYCQTCGAIYPVRPPRRCGCGCVKFWREEATPPTSSGREG